MFNMLCGLSISIFCTEIFEFAEIIEIRHGKGFETENTGFQQQVRLQPGQQQQQPGRYSRSENRRTP